MRPAICELCGKPAIDEIPPNEGDWIKFANYQLLDQFPLGHPAGMEYFCDEHLAAARPLAHETSEAALAKLREQYRDLPPYKKATPPRSMWQRLVAKVAGK